MPELQLYDHQEIYAPDLNRLADVGRAALPAILKVPGPQTAVLPELEEIEISFLSDEAISKVHAEFLNDSAPTDVITFAHGEILISVDTAIPQAVEHQQSTDRELALYMIHGLLHLNGHEDETESGFETMRQLQEEILRFVWPENDSESGEQA